MIQKPIRILVFIGFVFLTCYKAALGQDIPEIIPANINYNHFNHAVNNITLHRFSEDSALMKLFPGRFYKIKDGDDTYTFEAWNCSGWSPYEIKARWSSWPDTFPYRDGNDTRLIGTEHYINDGREFILFATSTMPMGSLIPVGRFNCAQLGIAIFEHTGNVWLLKAFNPNVVCAGAFSKAPMPQLLRLAGHVYGCSFINSNGPAGGAYYGELYITGLSQKNLRVLIKHSFAERLFDGTNEWKSSIACNTTAKEMPDITISTKGIYAKYSFDAIEDDTTFLKDFLGDAVTKSDSFSFAIKTTYRFEQDTFKLVNRKVIIDK